MESGIEEGVDGLLLPELYIGDNGEIQLELGDEVVHIGLMDELLQSPEFDDGVYETENGLMVCVEEFIENIRVSEEMTKEMMKAQQGVRDDSLPFSERLTIFYGLLYVKLRGNHVNQTPARY